MLWRKAQGEIEWHLQKQKRLDSNSWNFFSFVSWYLKRRLLWVCFYGIHWKIFASNLQMKSTFSKLGRNWARARRKQYVYVEWGMLCHSLCKLIAKCCNIKYENVCLSLKVMLYIRLLISFFKRIHESIQRYPAHRLPLATILIKLFAKYKGIHISTVLFNWKQIS